MLSGARHGVPRAWWDTSVKRVVLGRRLRPIEDSIAESLLAHNAVST